MPSNEGVVEGKEFGNYLFGEIDVLALESHPSPIEPYDPTRSLQLNPQHPVVAPSRLHRIEGTEDRAGPSRTRSSQNRTGPPPCGRGR